MQLCNKNIKNVCEEIMNGFALRSSTQMKTFQNIFEGVEIFTVKCLEMSQDQ